jgi:NADPH-dependent 2,4-dienoyl-CoA reductase/sulfur reductase-like enzyme
MSSPETVLIVGASVAGVRTVQALRLAGYDGSITLLGDEPHPPYDKPPLSKELLAADATGEAIPLLTSDELEALDVDLRLGVRAAALEPRRKVVHTQCGEQIGYDTLVIATGATPRTLAAAEHLAGVHTLRNLEDAQSLRALLMPERRAVVIGAGFIGSEFAAAARGHNVEVTMVEAQSEPLSQLLGESVGASLRRLQEEHGVRVLTGTQVDRFLGDEQVTGVVLADGQTLEADLVVVGIGARPAVDWLAGSGLPIEDGVMCDETLRVHGFPDIYSAGDVASRHHPLYDAPVRIEHWTNAGDHAALIAGAVTGRPTHAANLPYVWSDQHGKRIQIIGRPSLGSPDLVQGDAVSGDLLALYGDAEGRLVGALVIDDPRMLMKCRKAILLGASLQDFASGVTASP